MAVSKSAKMGAAKRYSAGRKYAAAKASGKAGGVAKGTASAKKSSGGGGGGAKKTGGGKAKKAKPIDPYSAKSTKNVKLQTAGQARTGLRRGEKAREMAYMRIPRSTPKPMRDFMRQPKVRAWMVRHPENFDRILMTYNYANAPKSIKDGFEAAYREMTGHAPRSASLNIVNGLRRTTGLGAKAAHLRASNPGVGLNTENYRK